jgi:acetylornithine/succinyldiaminopimelate/putrescine aminotransferase/predicted amino acid dehydrogenase
MNEYARGCRPRLAELLECLSLDVTYTRAQGAHLHHTDSDGTDVRVLDLVGGFGACLLGHNPPELRELVKAQLDSEVPFLVQGSIRRQAGLLAAALNGAIEARQSYLCHLVNSGAEAIEAALKHAYKVRFDAIRRELERVSREIEAFARAGERMQVDLALPGGARDLGRFRDDLDQHNLAEMERFQRSPVVLAFKGSFHGKTATALKVTFNRTYREAFEGLSAVQPRFLEPSDAVDLEPVLREHRIEFLVPRIDGGAVVLERVPASTIIALCLEVIQGEGGIRPLPDSVLSALAEQHPRLGIPYLVDEIQTGCGRTGSFLAFRAGPLAGIDPEYVTLGKALGGGLAKVAAAMIRDDVYDPDFGILHTSTFAEDEPGCVVARRAVEMITRDGGRLMRDAAEKGDYLLAALRSLRARFPGVIADVRGRGLMIGVEFADLRDRSPLFRFAARQGFLSLLVASYLLRHHRIRVLAPLTTLLKGNPGKKRQSVIRLQPPATITREEMDEAVSALAEVCTIIDRNHEGVLVAHLLGVAVTAAERSDPPARPVLYPAMELPAEFDARVGFIGHPAHVQQLFRYYFPSLASRVAPERLGTWWSRLARFLEPDVIHTDCVRSHGFVVQVDFVAVPYLPRDLMTAFRAGRAPAAPREEVLRLQEIQDRIQDAVTVARELGDDHIPTSVVGLGAYTSIVTEQGTSVNDFEVPVTTGNAYTAGLMLQGIRRAAALRGISLADATVAVVGAAGNIGSALAAMLTLEVGHLRLIGSDAQGSLERLQAARRTCLRELASALREHGRGADPANPLRPGRLAQRLAARVAGPRFSIPEAGWNGRAASGLERWGDDGVEALVARLETALELSGSAGDDPPITLHCSVEAIRDCQVVTVATNSPASRLISPELVRPGAVVACASVPSNLSAAFADRLGEFLVFDGGYARLPGAQGISIDCIGLPGDGQAFGCLSETLLLGLDGCSRSFARGPLTPEQVHETLAMAERHGFSLGDFKLNDAVHPLWRSTAIAA